MLSKEMVEEYKKIYKEKFGKDISYDEAYERGNKLVNLIKIIYRPIKKKDLNN